MSVQDFGSYRKKCVVSVENFTDLLEHGISIMEPVIHSLNSSFVANYSWSKTVAMAGNMQVREETGVGEKIMWFYTL